MKNTMKDVVLASSCHGLPHVISYPWCFCLKLIKAHRECPPSVMVWCTVPLAKYLFSSAKIWALKATELLNFLEKMARKPIHLFPPPSSQSWHLHWQRHAWKQRNKAHFILLLVSGHPLSSAPSLTFEIGRKKPQHCVWQPPFPGCLLVPVFCHHYWDGGWLIWEMKLDCCPKSTFGSPCDCLINFTP